MTEETVGIIIVCFAGASVLFGALVAWSSATIHRDFHRRWEEGIPNDIEEE